MTMPGLIGTVGLSLLVFAPMVSAPDSAAGGEAVPSMTFLEPGTSTMLSYDIACTCSASDPVRVGFVVGASPDVMILSISSPEIGIFKGPLTSAGFNSKFIGDPQILPEFTKDQTVQLEVLNTSTHAQPFTLVTVFIGDPQI